MYQVAFVPNQEPMIGYESQDLSSIHSHKNQISLPLMADSKLRGYRAMNVLFLPSAVMLLEAIAVRSYRKRKEWSPVTTFVKSQGITDH